MASLDPIPSLPETRAAEPTRVSAVEPHRTGPVAEAAAKLRAEQEAQRKNELIPANLMVRLDVDAERFVQTLTDATTDQTVLKYPSESQLALSRAVMAYLRALAEL
ncbi:MAG: hypothetical protein HY054_14980 [Proteobacteria bacterium]|nr:hypothetical protein [Pseudomonadota bacterium]